jgi:hypothetical protein
LSIYSNTISISGIVSGMFSLNTISVTKSSAITLPNVENVSMESNFIIHANTVNTTTNIIENSIQETQIQQSKILAIKPTLSAQAQSVNHRQLITSSNVISNSVDNILDVSSSPDVHYPLHSISPSGSPTFSTLPLQPSYSSTSTKLPTTRDKNILMTEIVSLSNSQSVHTDMLDSEYINLNNETHHGVYSTAGTFDYLLTSSSKQTTTLPVEGMLTSHKPDTNIYISKKERIHSEQSIGSISVLDQNQYKHTIMSSQSLKYYQTVSSFDNHLSLASLENVTSDGLLSTTSSPLIEQLIETNVTNSSTTTVKNIPIATSTPGMPITSSSFPRMKLHVTTYTTGSMEMQANIATVDFLSSDVSNVAPKYESAHSYFPKIIDSVVSITVGKQMDLSAITSRYGYQTLSPSLSSSFQPMESVVANYTFYQNETRITDRPIIHNKELYNYSFEIQFTGECRSLENKEALTEIWSSLMNIVGREAGTRGRKVKPINILCEPLRLSFKVYNATHKNLTENLQTLVTNDDFVITVLVDGYKMEFKAIRIYSFFENDIESDIFLMGLNEIDIIVIICATTISVILVCAGLIICAREYYLKKRTRSFTLSSFMSKGSKSYDYTLTKMPRPNSSYSENGVRMKSIGNREGPRAALLPIEEQETSVSDIQLRVNSNDDGIIVGVTGAGNSNLHEHQSSDRSCDHLDQSEERLCPRNDNTVQSVDNPIYYADDERFMNV